MNYEHDHDAEWKERTLLALQGDPRYAGWLEFTAWVISYERENAQRMRDEIARREGQEIAAYGQEER